MELLLAVLTAVLVGLFSLHLTTVRHRRARRTAGKLLLRVKRQHVKRWWFLGLQAPILLGVIVALTIVFTEPPTSRYSFANQAFLLTITAFNLGNVSWVIWFTHNLELRTQGIVGIAHQPNCTIAWQDIVRCKWSRPDTLLVQKRFELVECKVAPGQMREATAVLRQYMEVSDATGTIPPEELQRPDERQPADSEVPPKSRRFQFELQTALLFLLVASSAFSWYSVYHHRIDALKKTLEALEEFQPQVHRIGSSASEIDFSQSPNKPGDAQMRLLARIPTLRSLDLSDCPVTDEGLKHLANLKDLDILDLSNTLITDAGTHSLGKMPNICYLVLNNTRTSDAGLHQLRHLAQLETLFVCGTDISQNAIDRLEQERPKLNVHFLSKSVWPSPPKPTATSGDKKKNSIPPADEP